MVRKACQQYEVRYIGILGVLERAYIIDYITMDELKGLCRLLGSDETSCYISSNLIDDFIKLLFGDN